MRTRIGTLIFATVLSACSDASGPQYAGPWMSVAAGTDRTCALTSAGAAYCWGSGNLGDGLAKFYTRPVAVVGGLSFKSLASARGGLHVCAVTTAGAAYCWGDNRSGQLGDGSNTSSATPVAVAGGITFASLAAGPWHTCGVTPAGAAYCWGSNNHGQIGDGTFGGSITHDTPVLVSGGITFASLTAGGEIPVTGYFTCGLSTAGAAYCWGDNHYGEIGDGTIQGRYVPTAVGGGITFTSLAAGGQHVCGLTAGGSAYCWGNGDNNQMGNGSVLFMNMAPVAVGGGISFASLTAGGDHTCALSPAGAEYCWGNSNTMPTAIAGGITYASLATSIGHTCGLTPDGTAYCQGPNADGRLGDGSTDTRFTAVPVAGDLTFTSLATGGAPSFLGGNFSCGLTSAGAAYCWGSNVYGAVGNGSIPPVSRPYPVPVAGSISFASLVTGPSHTCGLTSTGTAYCWGRINGTPVAVSGNLTFQNLIGQGNNTCGLDIAGAAYCWDGGGSVTAVPLAVNMSFASLTFAGRACILNAEGAAYCWGARCNRFGVPMPSDPEPLPVPGGFRFRTLREGSGGGCDMCGVTAAGGGFCWDDRSVPVEIAGRRTWSTLFRGLRSHTCGLTTDGTAYCWGGNEAGQLGDGTGDPRVTPTPVAGGITFASLSPGEIHTCGVTYGGALYCWGDNQFGQLGDGSKLPHLTPELASNP